MSKTASKRLLDAAEACAAIARFTHGLEYAAYCADELVRAGVERKFGILGEALNQAAQIEPTVVEEIPDLRRTVGLRNRLVHGYDLVDDETVWRIIQTKLPGLEADLRRWLRARGHE